MNLPDPPPRMPPVRQEELTDDMRAFLKKWTGGIFNQADSNPVLLTFAHHPTLADLFSQLNIHLLSTNTLPVRLRQIAIMRTAWVCKATYMWSSHLNTSVRCGLEPALFRPIQAGADDPYLEGAVPIGFRLVAGASLQPLTIQHLNPAAMVVNQPGIVQLKGAFGRALPGHPQHVGDQLLRHQHFRTLQTIEAQQQPAASLLVERMVPITRSGLHHLCDQRLNGTQFRARLPLGTRGVLVDNL